MGGTLEPKGHADAGSVIMLTERHHTGFRKVFSCRIGKAVGTLCQPFKLKVGVSGFHAYFAVRFVMGQDFAAPAAASLMVS